MQLLYQPWEIIQQTFDERTHRALDTNNLDEIIELVVPYAVINSMLKPQYQVGESINIGINADTQSGAANEQQTGSATDHSNVSGNTAKVSPASVDSAPILVKHLTYHQ